MTEKKMNCKGPCVVGHLFALAGMYVLTWGLIDSASFWTVIKSPVFWGLFLLGVANCSMNASNKMSCEVEPKKK
jgi:hypothetical protein